MLSGNLQCPKALLQRCGNRSLPQCCSNALRHCGLLQCAQRIAAMAPLRQYCSNTVLQQYCGNAAAIAVLQQHCGNAHCKVLLQYCGNRGYCGNAFWYCNNTPIAVFVHVPKYIYGQYLHEVANACTAKWKLWRLGL